MSTGAPELLDTRGLFCPEPVMLLHNRIRDIAPGTVLTILATDPSTLRDIPSFCRYLCHELLSSDEVDGEFRYVVRK